MIEHQHEVVIVMEYCSGGRLSDFLTSRKVTISQSEQMLKQILRAVSLALPMHCGCEPCTADALWL